MTQTVLLLPGPAEMVAGEEARVGDPMTRIVLVPPGPAGGSKRGRGRPKKISGVEALIPAAPTIGVALIPAAPGGSHSSNR